MSLFGIFHGWLSRKKGLFEKLNDDIKQKIFFVHLKILEEYKAKTIFLQNPSQTSYEKLKDIIELQESLIAVEELNSSNIIRKLENCIAHEKITTQGADQFEEQLCKEITILLSQLKNLLNIVQEQLSLLKPPYVFFDIDLFRNKVKDEAKILAVEETEIKVIEKELNTALGYEYVLSKSEQKELDSLSEDDKQYVRLLKSPISQVRVTNIPRVFYRAMSSKLKARLIAPLTKDACPEVRAQALYFLTSEPLRDQKTIQIVLPMLKDKDPNVRARAINGIIELNSQDTIPLIEECLKDPIPIVRANAINALRTLNSIDSAPLIAPLKQDKDNNVSFAAKEFFHKFSVDLTTTHRLYRDQVLAKDISFFDPASKIARREFTKTGSRIVLLGGKFVGEVIVRIVPEPAFLAWKKAFEAKDIWQSVGFDYVPIEPILIKGKELRAYKTKDGTYRVYTKVLGPSLEEFLKSNAQDSLKSKLKNDEEVIRKVLAVNLAIAHGHDHRSNFCVEFSAGKPRLYLIDFDQAISPLK